MVRMGDTIAPIEPPKDTIQDTSSRIKPPVPNINMLGGPKMIQPVEPQNEFLKGNIKEPVNIEVMGKPSPVKPIEPEPIGGTDAMNDFIDANMLELKHTGFMSNRGRQNVASYLCNDLKLDWRLGAAYFEQQLIDYDVCSNWGNWAYLAGVGNDPRGNRYFNIEKQASDYDKNGDYRNLWLQGR
jgi:hypothetical protein